MKKSFLSIFLVLSAIVTGWIVFNRASGLQLDPAELLGGVVMTENAGAPRLYYLTSQWEKLATWSRGRASASQNTTSWLNVDLWEIDATTAQPISRRRIKRDKVNADSKAIGLEEGVLWARIPELVGIRLADGAIVVDRETIAARNPSIADFLPKPPTTFFLPDSMQPLKFTPEAGMIVRLDDARKVRIDPLTSEATPYIAANPDNNPPSENDSPTSRKKVISPSNGTDWRAMARGLLIPQNGVSDQWLGLLTAADLEQMKQHGVVSPRMDFTKPQRSRLYRAVLQEEGGFMGRGMLHQNPTLLTDSPDFLMAGLLTQELSDNNKAVAAWRREPDSVFVLSHDRIGEEGRLQLTRASSENGAPIWSVALPLSDLRAWIPQDRYALILGPAPTAERSPMAGENENSVTHILSVDLTTGAIQSFNPDLHRDWPLQEISKTP